jgi:hypothetical protein
VGLVFGAQINICTGVRSENKNEGEVKGGGGFVFSFETLIQRRLINHAIVNHPDDRELSMPFDSIRPESN